MSWADAWSVVSPRDQTTPGIQSPRPNTSSAIDAVRQASDAMLTPVRGGASGATPMPGDYAFQDSMNQFVTPWATNVVYGGMDTINDAAGKMTWPGQDDQNKPTGSGSWSTTPGGPATPGAAGWEASNALDQVYTDTANQTGVPGNFIKSIQGLETGRVPNRTDQNCELRQGDCVALNSGIYQSTAASYGLDYNRIVRDPEYAAYAVGVVLQNIAYGDPDPSWGVPAGQTVLEAGGWEGVAKVYFGGDITGNFVDEQGRSGNEYAGQVFDYVNELGGLNSAPITTPTDPNAPTPGGVPGPNGTVITHPPPASAVTSMADMWGGSDEAIIAGLGDTSAVQTSGNPNYYDYAKEMGFEGNPGITVALPPNTAVTAPVSGTVVSVGSGYFPDGGGGIGEIRLETTTGDIIILGHMATSNYQVGDMVSVGDPLGTSGRAGTTDDSGALQLEVRVKQPDGTYKVADPSVYFAPAGTTQNPTTTDDGTIVTSPGNPASSYTSDPRGQQIADLADNYVNGPAYVLGAIPTAEQDPYQTGWDCSGFVFNIADQLGMSADQVAGGVPRGSHPQAAWAIDNGAWVDGNDVNALQAGDIVFFDTQAEGGGGQYDHPDKRAQRSTHVGIYLGDGKMINAMQACGPGLTNGVDCGTGVVDITTGYWHDAMLGSARMY